MVPLTYWAFRLLRRSLPQRAVDWMLDRGVFLKAGLDTSDPRAAVERYRTVCRRFDFAIEGKVVCVVGYGGSAGVGLHLLEAGARQVILQDPYAALRPARQQRLDPELLFRYGSFEQSAWRPDEERLRVVRDDLPAYAEAEPESVALVVSSSVMEHVPDVDAMAAACARLTRPAGLNVHFVDLRDHFFRYPFEMLCYSERTWRRWLNASNKLNRLRMRDYERIFGRHFRTVEFEVTLSLPAELRRVRKRVRPEFLTGEEAHDAAAMIRMVAQP